MSENKSTISQAQSYQAIGEFWDTHDLTDFWEQTAPAEFEVDLQSQTIYYAVDQVLSVKIMEIAQQRGVSPETMLNLLVQAKLQEMSVA
jgi:hypothetical protein